MSSNELTTILVNLGPLVIIILMFWLFIVRPQQKKAKEHQKAVNEMKQGTGVIFANGIRGVFLRREGEKFLMIEIARDVVVGAIAESVTHIITDDESYKNDQTVKVEQRDKAKIAVKKEGEFTRRKPRFRTNNNK
ncbi:preprotein translocase subunit YajC [Candidatus Fokinia solitaria]|uniref:Sec translocon accessory complex subunit YajC n=1 Tax=Candidatus Fokinia solitaria TaxID=1802984 RepID=A0A2U8BT03_9RICK|nr:preprotein translocase subunit YajC [Candidatus Fokinia solitaria]AWD33481.1 preprotein translocase subunit YajC [Candidatus Fokinia solitaria]